MSCSRLLPIGKGLVRLTVGAASRPVKRWNVNEQPDIWNEYRTEALAAVWARMKRCFLLPWEPEEGASDTSQCDAEARVREMSQVPGR